VAVEIVLMLVGSAVAEYVIQPEAITASKADGDAGAYRFVAMLVHGSIWTTLTFVMGAPLMIQAAQATVLSAIFASILCLLSLFALHAIVDSGPVRDLLIRILRVPSIHSSTELMQNVDFSKDPNIAAAVVTYAIFGEKAFDATMHAIVVLMGWCCFQIANWFVLWLL
jgi:hypothetical protein